MATVFMLLTHQANIIVIPSIWRNPITLLFIKVSGSMMN